MFLPFLLLLLLLLFIFFLFFLVDLVVDIDGIVLLLLLHLILLLLLLLHLLLLPLLLRNKDLPHIFVTSSNTGMSEPTRWDTFANGGAKDRARLLSRILRIQPLAGLHWQRITPGQCSQEADASSTHGPSGMPLAEVRLTSSFSPAVVFIFLSSQVVQE